MYTLWSEYAFYALFSVSLLTVQVPCSLYVGIWQGKTRWFCFPTQRKIDLTPHSYPLYDHFTTVVVNNFVQFYSVSGLVFAVCVTVKDICDAIPILINYTYLLFLFLQLNTYG